MSPHLPSPLHGFRVAVSSALAGRKFAIKQGDTVYVSPAMYDLMSHADEAELERLLGAIRVIEIPELTSLFEGFGLYTDG